MAQKKSFTLIELLVTIFILILMVTILVIVFQRGSFQRKQNDNTRKKDINELAVAIEEFKADHGHYPYINWGGGQHAYEVLKELDPVQYNFTTGDPVEDQCNGTARKYRDALGAHYGYEPSRAEILAFWPGTELRSENNLYCDDLSLQLLGKAYLPKMVEPSHDAAGDDFINNQTDAGWITSGSQLKRYLDEMPDDPLLVKGDTHYYYVTDHNLVDLFGGVYGFATTDYDPAGSDDPLFRYFYNSYYNCPEQAIVPGERYWLNAIMQLAADGEYFSDLEIYFYEIGNYNWARQPASYCP